MLREQQRSQSIGGKLVQIGKRRHNHARSIA
jgi:hypothetical protein